MTGQISKWTTEEVSDADKEGILKVFCKKNVSVREQLKNVWMAANPDVKCQNSKYRKGLLLMLFYNCILLQLQLVIHVEKDFSDLNVQPGLSVSQFASGKSSSFSSLFGEGLGGKRTYRDLTLAVILLSGNLNFAYTGIWGMNRKCPITQWVQEQCWNSAMPLTSSKHVFLCKIGMATFSRVVKRMHISKVHWNCGQFWI